MSVYRHEALFYEGTDGFLAAAVPMVREAIAAGDAVLAAIAADRVEALAAELGPAADAVVFVDMASIGRNPARIIPVWEDFLREHLESGRAVLGIGEPIWPGRTEDELVECHRHEALLNVAFSRHPPFRLVCPYDTAALDPEVVAAARCTHPHVIEQGSSQDSADYVSHVPARFAEPLPPAPKDAAELTFNGGGLAAVRSLVSILGRRAGLETERCEDLVLAVNELATNSLRHATGEGSLLIWQHNGALMCEVRDYGRIEDPLAGRRRPEVHQPGGRGLWMVNHLCDLVHLRATPHGTAIRVRMDRPAAETA